MTPLDLFTAAATGLGAGLSLIIAIGAQNAFVLRQGIRGEYVGLVVLVCTISDMALIAAGIFGIGALVRALPGVVVVIRLAGAAFLLAYGVLAAKRALRPGTLTSGTQPRASGRHAVLATALALTWLNPHVYLDTVLLLGTLANQHGGQRWWFGAGAALGSVLWFTALGFGARLIRPVFAKPGAWRVLDGAIAAVMVFLAARMVFGF